MAETYGGGAGGKKTLVKNKAPAPIQITAEQLLREAVERQGDEVSAPKQRIVDDEELQDYRVRKRKEFEDHLRQQRMHMGTWIKYALWEGGQKEFRRARSIFERALNVEYQNVTLWAKYIEMELKEKFINSARNLYDRVVQLLPRVDQFWYKYCHMEELLGNYAGAREVFERWMEWEPEDSGWMLYVKFEERCHELERARRVFERFLSCRPSQEGFLKFCRFEERQRSTDRTRAGFEKAIEILPKEELDETFFIKFAQFEARRKEMDRAKTIYRLALAQLPKSKSEALYRCYVALQKQHGSREEIEDTIVQKRRYFYEAKLAENRLDYDAWFDFLKLEETTRDCARIRDLYERAVAQVPPVKEKKYWSRYVYLWLYYASFEELLAADVERCRRVYVTALDVVPHKLFSFSKLWRQYAEFEVRQLNLDKARLVYGRAIAECGTDAIFTSYANLELRLGNIDRCRTIYCKFIETHPERPAAWTALVELELMAEEQERARHICELAIQMEQMDMPEVVWKMYIDMEVDLGELQKARSLYERLLEKTHHFKVYKGFADFELTAAEDAEAARKVLEEGLQHMKREGVDDERAALLEHWLMMERRLGDKQRINAVWQRQPKRVKRKRTAAEADGERQGIDEYTAYVFPEDGMQASNLKILEAAKRWKQQKTAS